LEGGKKMTEEKPRVLVVDDEEGIRILLKRILEEAGYQVTTADNGKDAVYKASVGEADVVLMDIKMPEMSGIEALGKMTVDAPDTCVIMVTSIADMETAISAMKMGAYDYITKPFDSSDVVTKVLNAIERREKTLKEKRRYLQLQDSIMEKTQKMQDQFAELMNSLAREHRLLHELSARQGEGGKSLLSKLPQELQEPIATVEEFRDALLRILRGK
jgi:DNA-binding NtrC family response regulator